MSLTQINKAGLDEIALDHVFTIGASGSSAYTFQGEGLNGTVNNPTLYLTRGKTYRFENGSGGHPIRIQSTSGASGTAYNTGVTNNAGSGTVIVEVQHDAPDVLYYQCTSHAAMNGVLYITGALADGGVTTAKIADDAVTDAKLANSINSAIAANTAKTSLEDNSVTTARIASNAVVTSKILDGAINNAKVANDADIAGSKLADDSISLAKLQHGTSSNDGKFLRANNGADPTFETVSIPAGTTINNNADNRFITGSGTANTLEAESNFQFASNRLLYGGASSSLETSFVLKGNSNSFVTNPARMFLQAGQDMGGGASIGIMDFGCTGDKIGAHIIGRAHQDYSGSNYSTNLEFWTANPSSTTRTKKVEIGADGNVDIVDGNLVLASGHGIDFSATGNSNGTMSNELLDDYEEGTFTPTISSGYSYANTITYAQQSGFYTKIGNVVYTQIYLQPNGNSAHSNNIIEDGNRVQIDGLPFANTNTTNAEGGGYITYQNGFFDNSGTANEDLHAMPWVQRNQSHVYFHNPVTGGQIAGNKTHPTGRYLIFQIRYFV